MPMTVHYPVIRNARSSSYETIDRLIRFVDENPNDLLARHALAEELEDLDPEDWRTGVWYGSGDGDDLKSRIAELRDPNARVGAYQIVRDNVKYGGMLGNQMGGEGPLPQHQNGYPIYYLTHDYAPLCHNCVNDNIRQSADEIKNPDRSDSYRPVAYEVNWEAPDLHCDQCGNQIESAYGDDNADNPGEELPGVDDQNFDDRYNYARSPAVTEHPQNVIDALFNHLIRNPTDLLARNALAEELEDRDQHKDAALLRQSIEDKARAIRKYRETANSRLVSDPLSDSDHNHISSAMWTLPEGNAGVDDIHPDVLASMLDDWHRFRTQHRHLIEAGRSHPDDPSPEENAAHDFWLSRNGHEAGFFDTPGQYGGNHDRLQEAAQKYGEFHLEGPEPQVEPDEFPLHIYQADTWCPECADSIRQELLSNGYPNGGGYPSDDPHFDPDDESTYDSDAFPKYGGGETGTYCASGQNCPHFDEDANYGERNNTITGTSYVNTDEGPHRMSRVKYASNERRVSITPEQEEAALLQHITANPDDISAHQAYAELLHEQGRHGEAALVQQERTEQRPITFRIEGGRIYKPGGWRWTNDPSLMGGRYRTGADPYHTEPIADSPFRTFPDAVDFAEAEVGVPHSIEWSPSPDPSKPENYGWNVLVSPTNDEQDTPIRHSAYRAPKGGAVVRGTYYQGGKLIPDLEGDFANPPVPEQPVVEYPQPKQSLRDRLKSKFGRKEPLVVSYARAPKSKPPVHLPQLFDAVRRLDYVNPDLTVRNALAEELADLGRHKEAELLNSGRYAIDLNGGGRVVKAPPPPAINTATRRGINYRQLREQLDHGRTRRIGNNREIANGPDGDIHVHLHGNHVVTAHPDGSYSLFTGQWHTPTTFAVHQEITGERPNRVRGMTMFRGEPFEEGVRFTPGQDG